MKIRHFFPSDRVRLYCYVREFDNGIPLAWVKDRTVVMQLSLGTGTRILRDGFTSLTIPPLTRSRPGTRISHIFNFPG
ncbi:MAG: hypothetical protein DME47_01040 [Verrucomicrobia bacterium]|nr:MAG: hypothetical protein DME47_01040 [Verrucomicrobiota bacterium]